MATKIDPVLPICKQKKVLLRLDRWGDRYWHAPVLKGELERRRSACSALTLGTNAWAGPDLLVPEAIHGAIEPANVETLRLRASGAARDDDAIAWLQRLAGHTDIGQFRSVVHLEAPSFRVVAGLDVHRQKRMRIDEVKLGDNTFDLHLLVAVVNTRDRMMRIDRDS
jgi:hypothetical protein